jgi:hypothetical protein
MSARLHPLVVEKRLTDLRLRNIICLDEYKGARKQHTFSCLLAECNYQWITTYDNVVNKGSGCPKCSGKIVDSDILKNQFNCLLERNIRCLDDYKGSNIKHRFECLNENCGRVWYAVYDSVARRGSTCPYCSKHILPADVINEKLTSLIERNISCLSGYIGTHDKHEFQCLVKTCEHIWVASYNNVVNKGSGCPRCVGKALTSEEKVVSRIRASIRARITAALSSIDSTSFSNFHGDDLLGYCQQEYLTILPKPKGLTLDHILPLNIFDPKNDLEMKLCWNRRNLRWITGKENSSKNNKIVFDLFDDWHYLVYNLVSSGDYDVELAKSLLD